MPALSSHRTTQRSSYDLISGLTQTAGQGIARVSDVKEWHRLAETLPMPVFSATEVPNLRLESLQAVQAQAPNSALLLLVETLDLLHQHCSSVEHRGDFLQYERILVIRNRYQVALSHSEALEKSFSQAMAIGRKLSLVNGRTKVSGAVVTKLMEDLKTLLSVFLVELTKMRWSSKDQEQAKRLRLVQ